MKALRVTWSFGSCTSFLPPADTTIRSTVNRHERAAQDQNKRHMTNLAHADPDKTSLADADSDHISLVDADFDNTSLTYPDSDNTSLADVHVDSITCATTMHRC